MGLKLRKTNGRTYFDSTIEEFVSIKNHKEIIDFLAESEKEKDSAKLFKQVGAWINQIRILQRYLKGKRGYIIFEFILASVNMRIDVILLMGGVIYSIEFKNNERTFDPDAEEQANGYGYALKNFYEVNRDKYVVPILVATKAPKSICSKGSDLGIDKLFSLFEANEEIMCEYIDSIKSKYEEETIFTQEEFEDWIKSPFKPNPTIIESAKFIYSSNTVDDLKKFDASEENLRETEETLENVIEEAKAYKKKIICFVSGVPGAGKTLVGLDIAGKSRISKETGSPEVLFFSGNKPLINVLTEALGRDAIKHHPEKYSDKYKAVADTKTFIQNLYAFKSDYLSSKKRKIDSNVLIFDEAQRVWDRKKLGMWLRDEKNEISEADLLLDVLSDKEWGVIIALVGLGQDIYIGEDGLSLWFESLSKKYTDWEIRISKEIFEQKADDLNHYKYLLDDPRVKENNGLYLKTSIRTPRARNLSDFVNALLDNEPEKANATLKKFNDYPICITRSLTMAEKFVRESINYSVKERGGKLCSSSGAIVKWKVPGFRVLDNKYIANWMLNDEGFGSSNSLKLAATEFDIQGLEIDWSLLGWDMDMYFDGSKWCQQKLSSKKLSDDVEKKHILNTYRVLLTRARKGLVIYIPKNSDAFHEYENAKYLDATYNYLKSCGIKELDYRSPTFFKIRDAAVI